MESYCTTDSHFFSLSLPLALRHADVQNWPAWPTLNNAHLYSPEWKAINTLNSSAATGWLQGCFQFSSHPLCIRWRQMKADFSSCWLCLSDMFSLIPSPRVVPAGLLSQTASWAWGEVATRKKQLHRAAASEYWSTTDLTNFHVQNTVCWNMC